MNIGVGMEEKREERRKDDWEGRGEYRRGGRTEDGKEEKIDQKKRRV